MQRFAGVLLVDPRGWLLLQERDEHAPIDPLRWGIPGGHVDDGEEYEAAAHRELAEETGIRVGDGDLELWREIEVFHDVYDSLDRMRVYVGATRLTDDDVVLGEGRQIVFVAPDEALGLELTAAASSILPDFLDSSTYRRLCQ